VRGVGGEGVEVRVEREEERGEERGRSEVGGGEVKEGR